MILPDEPDEPFGPPLGYASWRDGHTEVFYSQAHAETLKRKERTFMISKSTFVKIPGSFDPRTLTLTIDKWDTEKDGPPPTMQEVMSMIGTAVMNDPEGDVWSEYYWKAEVTEGADWVCFADKDHHKTRADFILADNLAHPLEAP